jgi:hypothetical protein
LTWVRPATGDSQIGETLVVFVDPAAAAEFAGGGLGGRGLLARADIRLFEGETERTGTPIPIDDAKVLGGSGTCP